MIIESRHFDNGKAFIKKVAIASEDAETEKYDVYYEEVENLQAWIEDNLYIDSDGIVALEIELESGFTVDISKYI